MIQKSRLVLPAIILTAIAATAVLFHYPITIVDALTLESLPEFGVQISWWRLLFEPFLGILLFFNQSFHAIPEFLLFGFWAILIYLGFSITKAFWIKEKRARRRFIARQSVNIPIVLGLLFAVFAVMIFIPLPGNIIINNKSNAVLVNTHSHTEFSHDGLISQEGLWKWHKRNGFDAFFITDHNNHSKTLEFVRAQRNGQVPGDPLVMGGEEFSGTNHLSLLGLRHEFKTKGFSDSLAVQHTRADSGAVLVNHWFDGERKSLEYYKNLGVDGFEIENTATDKRYDRKVYRKIKDFCTSNGLIMNGGLDFHGYGSACSMWNAFDIPGWKNLDPSSREAAILNIIRTRDQGRMKVLLYNDRPYYSGKQLFFRPFISIVNYFRTLNILQVVSWMVWILIFSLAGTGISKNRKLSALLNAQIVISVLGLIAALFLTGLGLTYFSRITAVENFTEMYEEYSHLLLYTGASFLLYSGVVAWKRIKNGRETD
jgi:hypothetical protein